MPNFAKLLRDPALGMAFDKEHLFYRLKRFPYYVVFRLEPARLFVVAVSHNRRDPAYWQGR